MIAYFRFRHSLTWVAVPMHKAERYSKHEILDAVEKLYRINRKYNYITLDMEEDETTIPFQSPGVVGALHPVQLGQIMVQIENGTVRTRRKHVGFEYEGRKPDTIVVDVAPENHSSVR